MDALYVSPHPDDVAFSAAARVARDVAAGLTVGVITLFPPAGQGPRAVSDVDARRAEDERFARLARVELLDGGFVDGIARRPRYRALRHLFGPLAADEEPLIDEVRALLQARIDAGCRRVMAPLGIGQHVDHQIAHEAARRLTGADVLFYEDTPYVLTPYQLARRFDRLALATEIADDTLRRGGARELSASARAWLQAPLLDELAPHRLLALTGILLQTELWHWPRRPALPLARATPDVLEDVAAPKLEAVACYESQWRLFFPALQAWTAALEEYSQRAGFQLTIERAWRIST